MKLIASLRALIGAASPAPDKRIEPALEPSAAATGPEAMPERIEPVCPLPSRNAASIERVQWHLDARR
jgi:hypothetical protein